MTHAFSRVVALVILGAVVTPTARAQQGMRQPGTGLSGPGSDRASNIDGAPHGEIAPHLPTSAAGPDATANDYFRAADAALVAHRTGEAQQALEMAETRLLDRSTEIGANGRPDNSPQVLHASVALRALGGHDIVAARGAIAAALAVGGGATMPAPPIMPPR